MIAMMAVNLAVVSIGSSPFRLEGCPFRNLTILLGPLGQCQAVSLLRRTMAKLPQAELNNVHAALRFHGSQCFFASAGAAKTIAEGGGEGAKRRKSRRLG
jgi:hypothetical protein